MFELFLSPQSCVCTTHAHSRHYQAYTQNVFTPKTPLAPSAQIFRLRLSNSFLWIEVIGWCLNSNFTSSRLLQSTVKHRERLYGLKMCSVCTNMVHVSIFISILSVEPYESCLLLLSHPPSLLCCLHALFPFYAKVLHVPSGQLLMRNYVVSLIKT